MTATLIACSHGTSDPAGRRAVTALVSQIADLVPGMQVKQAFVDVEHPEVDDVVAESIAHGPVVVVPLLLSTGFHVKVDIARAVAPYPGRAVATAALGPHPLLPEVLHSRLTAVGVTSKDAIVLAAAGSSDPAASVAVREVADDLEERLGRKIDVGFAAGVGTRIDEAVALARSGGATRVVVASYVLAPGFFADRVAASGADVVTAPLAPDVRMASIVRERFERALVGLSALAAA